MANRVAEVNRELKRLGHAEKLTRGRGYYYFRDGDAPTWRGTMVCVCYSDDLTVKQWVAERNQLAAGGW